MRKTGKIILGILLVAIGLLFAYNALFDPDINIFFDGWWTLFIIVPSVIGIIEGRDVKSCLVGLAIGVAFLLSAQNIIDLGLVWKLIIPAALIFAGASIIFKDVVKSKLNKEIKTVVERNRENNHKNAEHFAIFSGHELDFSGVVFDGSDMTAVFGGIDCDISRAVINEDVVINANAIFGGVDIFVSRDVNVKVKATSIFGGASKGRKAAVPDAPTVYVNAVSVFGGVEIK